MMSTEREHVTVEHSEIRITEPDEDGRYLRIPVVSYVFDGATFANGETFTLTTTETIHDEH